MILAFKKKRVKYSSIFEMMTFRMTSTPSASPLSSPPPQSSPSAVVPHRVPVPGSHGWPVIGPLSDRLNYFWFQGPETFFKKRIEKYKSTVFRTNVPPSFPFFLRVNPNVIAVLDIKSFSHLFDMEIVEKADVLVGDFMPSVNFTGGLRVCPYLDTSELKHSQVKSFSMEILKQSSSNWVPTMKTSLDTLWDSIETQLSKSNGGGGVSYQFPLLQFLFTFLNRSLLRADPSTTLFIDKYGYLITGVWLGFQLVPTININTLQPLVEIFLHSFTYPSWLIKPAYRRLVDFVKNQAKDVVLQAQTEFNLTEEEAIHNLLFILGFNAFGGFAIFFPALMSAVGDNKSLHDKLRNEVRQTIAKNGNALSIQSVNQMELINSFVYETLRLNPPVPIQYARARKDFDLASNNGLFSIKKGELLCGYQPLVMKDSSVFENPEDFVYDRFTKEKGGEELLKYLYWSNGPQIGGGPSASNKQCPGRDMVPITAALFLADLFQRYDDITISSGSITALKKAIKI